MSIQLDNMASSSADVAIVVFKFVGMLVVKIAYSSDEINSTVYTFFSTKISCSLYCLLGYEILKSSVSMCYSKDHIVFGYS